MMKNKHWTLKKKKSTLNDLDINMYYIINIWSSFVQKKKKIKFFLSFIY